MRIKNFVFFLLCKKNFVILVSFLRFTFFFQYYFVSLEVWYNRPTIETRDSFHFLRLSYSCFTPRDDIRIRFLFTFRSLVSLWRLIFLIYLLLTRPRVHTNFFLFLLFALKQPLTLLSQLSPGAKKIRFRCFSTKIYGSSIRLSIYH